MSKETIAEIIERSPRLLNAPDEEAARRTAREDEKLPGDLMDGMTGYEKTGKSYKSSKLWAVREKIVELRYYGQDNTNIAKKFGVHRSTVANCVMHMREDPAAFRGSRIYARLSARQEAKRRRVEEVLNNPINQRALLRAASVLDKMDRRWLDFLFETGLLQAPKDIQCEGGVWMT